MCIRWVHDLTCGKSLMPHRRQYLLPQFHRQLPESSQEMCLELAHSVTPEAMASYQVFLGLLVQMKFAKKGYFYHNLCETRRTTTLLGCQGNI